MVRSIESLELELLGLPAVDRARLLDRVVASLDADRARDEAWDQVAATRDSEIERGTANRFLIEFERICELLSANPELGIPTQGQRRRFPLHGFPYSIIYRPAPDGLRILVVRHQSRDPTSREQQR